MTVPVEIPQRFGGMEKALNRGRERFGIYCAPCHDNTGRGKGMVAQRAATIPGAAAMNPTNLHKDTVRHMPDGQLFATISNGVRNMPAYGAQIPTEDRWAIVAYVRALELSRRFTRVQNDPVSRIPAPSRRRRGGTTAFPRPARGPGAGRSSRRSVSSASPSARGVWAKRRDAASFAYLFAFVVALTKARSGACSSFWSRAHRRRELECRHPPHRRVLRAVGVDFHSALDPDLDEPHGALPVGGGRHGTRGAPGTRREERNHARSVRLRARAAARRLRPKARHPIPTGERVFAASPAPLLGDPAGVHGGLGPFPGNMHGRTAAARRRVKRRPSAPSLPS